MFFSNLQGKPIKKEEYKWEIKLSPGFFTPGLNQDAEESVKVPSRVFTSGLLSSWNESPV